MSAHCERCSAEDVHLFYLPDAWQGGICNGCALAGDDTCARFTAHFGTVVFKRDGDAGTGHAKT